MDGCGKSTVAKLIQQKLGKENCELVIFPSNGKFGSVIRSVLRGEKEADRSSLIFAFAADGVEESTQAIRPALAAGKVVVSDRHPLVSALVYQLEDHSLDFINQVRSLAVIAGAVEPSFLVYLDVPPEEARARMANRAKYVDAVYEPSGLEAIAKHRQAYRRAFEVTRGIWCENNGSADAMAEEIIHRFRLRERGPGSSSRPTAPGASG